MGQWKLMTGRDCDELSISPLPRGMQRARHVFRKPLVLLAAWGNFKARARLLCSIQTNRKPLCFSPHNEKGNREARGSRGYQS